MKKKKAVRGIPVDLQGYLEQDPSTRQQDREREREGERERESPSGRRQRALSHAHQSADPACGWLGAHVHDESWFKSATLEPLSLVRGGSNPRSPFFLAQPKERSDSWHFSAPRNFQCDALLPSTSFAFWLCRAGRRLLPLIVAGFEHLA